MDEKNIKLRNRRMNELEEEIKRFEEIIDKMAGCYEKIEDMPEEINEKFYCGLSKAKDFESVLKLILNDWKYEVKEKL